MTAGHSTQPKQHSIPEEIGNSVTHGIGTLLSIAGLVLLVVQAVRFGNAWNVVSYSIFGSTMVLLYLTSTLYHGIQHPGVKALLKKFDHSAIFLLIAGTYTPFLLVSLRGDWGWSLFGIIWGLAICGIVFKFLFIEKFKILSVFLYIIMGWLVVIVFPKIIQNISTSSLTFLIIGGVSYTLGTIFYGWRKLPFAHVIWHFFVLGGTIMHFFAVLKIL